MHEYAMVAILLFVLGCVCALAMAGGMLNLLFWTVFRTRH
jgi:hypothetical protein